MAKAKKVQLKDVAKEANVSIALVSYVLNDRLTNRIKKETADRIKEVAKRLNYRANHFAKGLKTDRSNTIGLVLADLSNPFSTQIARIIEKELRQNNYNVLIGSSDENADKLEEIVDIFKSQLVDGLIILPTENSQKVIDELHNSQFPYVLIDRYFPDKPYNFVVNDNQYCTYMTTNEILKNGKKKIGLISFRSNLTHISKRTTGFVQACEEAGLTTDGMIKEARLEHLEEDVPKEIEALINENNDLDAILFSTDNLTLFGLKYAIAHRWDLSNDIEIIAIDKANFYDLYPRPISYYRQPLELMGTKAVQFLMSTIQGEESQVIQEMVRGELVIG